MKTSYIRYLLITSYFRQALIDDSVKFESSLTHIEELLDKQKEEVIKLEVRLFKL